MHTPKTITRKQHKKSIAIATKHVALRNISKRNFTHDRINRKTKNPYDTERLQHAACMCTTGRLKRHQPTKSTESIEINCEMWSGFAPFSLCYYFVRCFSAFDCCMVVNKCSAARMWLRVYRVLKRERVSTDKTRRLAKHNNFEPNEETCSHREPCDQVMIVRFRWANDEMLKSKRISMAKCRRPGINTVLFVSFPYQEYAAFDAFVCVWFVFVFCVQM